MKRGLDLNGKIYAIVKMVIAAIEITFRNGFHWNRKTLKRMFVKKIFALIQII